ncbi:hypothetical protein AVHY2522_22955 [Acidovorax sp. SUPP2522]|uniref:hypothetical protein n=1 Tax=unclassified Acidovorax TaxID=2684926 RepID=UPI00234B68C4|nr:MULTISPECIES: hypothetical protein [unclassified Acidovorax]WCM95714.1 hypothetical protein M5C96_14620 [Acidovorax sp. GBBC 1281]GKT19567.1 hypothetical protein AVHY2522_22955 [Acidovorax sp. SUPP2522]
MSGDLLVKLALLAGGALLAVYVVRRATQAATDAAAAVWAPVDAAAQWVRNQTAYVGEAVGGAAQWVNDEIHFENHPEYEFMGPPNPYESGSNGDYTSVTPPVTGSGGAAFGMYPRVIRRPVNTGGAEGSW